MTKESAVVDSNSDEKHKDKISVDELQIKMRDPRISKGELAKYLLIDNNSGPFDLKLAPNPNTVDIPPYEAAIGWGKIFTTIFNQSERERRLKLFNETINSGYTGPVIVSEGDSWFMYFPLDILDNLRSSFAIRSLEAAGDTLQNIVDEHEYLDAISDTNASIFLLSAGGNDVVADGNLQEYLRNFDPSLSPSDHLLPSFYGFLDKAMALYERILQEIEALSTDILMICHGYDYCIPRDQSWLGQPMIERGITDTTFQAAIASTMIDEFNIRLKLLTDKFGNARYLDLRGVVGSNRWANELHPNFFAFIDLAAKFKAEIDKSVVSQS